MGAILGAFRHAAAQVSIRIRLAHDKKLFAIALAVLHTWQRQDEKSELALNAEGARPVELPGRLSKCYVPRTGTDRMISSIVCETS